MNGNEFLSFEDCISDNHFSMRIGSDGVMPCIPLSSMLSFQEIGSVAYNMNSNYYYFVRKHKIITDYTKDLDGSGVQLIKIEKRDEKDRWIASLLFIYTNREAIDYCYEDNLMVDQRKDYLPTLNRGKHKFRLDKFSLSIEDRPRIERWINEDFPFLRSEVARLNFDQTSLEAWVNSRIDMAVSCLLCRPYPIIIQFEKLRTYLDKNYSFEDLRSRLVCSKCGRNYPDISPS